MNQILLTLLSIYMWFPYDPPPDRLLPQTSEHYELTGNVKMVTVDYYEAYPKGSDLKFRNGYVYTFNKKGFMISDIQTKGIQTGKKYFFQFENDTHLVRVDGFNKYSTDTADQWRYEYNDYGQIIRINEYTKGKQWDLMNIYTFGYYNSGKVKSVFQQRKWEAESEKRQYVYDSESDDEVNKEIIYHNEAIYLTKTTRYKDGNPYRQEDEYASGSNYKTIWEYNGHGHRTKATIEYTGPSGKELTTYTWEYKYDSKGNWTQKTVKENGLMYCREERRIEY